MYNFLCSDSLLYFFLFLSTLHSVYTRDCSCSAQVWGNGILHLVYYTPFEHKVFKGPTRIDNLLNPEPRYFIMYRPFSTLAIYIYI